MLGCYFTQLTALPLFHLNADDTVASSYYAMTGPKLFVIGDDFPSQDCLVMEPACNPRAYVPQFNRNILEKLCHSWVSSCTVTPDVVLCSSWACLLACIQMTQWHLHMLWHSPRIGPIYNWPLLRLNLLPVQKRLVVGIRWCHRGGCILDVSNWA